MEEYTMTLGEILHIVDGKVRNQLSKKVIDLDIELTSRPDFFKIKNSTWEEEEKALWHIGEPKSWYSLRSK